MTEEEKIAAEEAAKKLAAETQVPEGFIAKALAKIESIAKAIQKSETEVKDKEKDVKPFAKEAAGNSDEIAKAVEVSDFLKDITSEIGGALDSMSKDLAKAVSTQLEVTKEQSEVIKTLTDGLKEVKESVDKLATAPATGLKAVISKGQERFNDEENPDAPSTSVIKKALASLIAKGEATPMDMVRLESVGKIDKALYDKIVIKKEVK